MTRMVFVSSRPFDEVVQRLMTSIGRPNIDTFRREVGMARTGADLERVVLGAIGPSGLMEFARFDAGEILRKYDGQGARILRLVVGNPIIMKEMVKSVPDAASYAPITILVDERADGVHLSYDSAASLIEPYQSQAALAVARELDEKVYEVLEMTARAESQGEGT